MNKTSVLHAPSWAHQGEFIAGATMYQFQVCRDQTSVGDGTASSEGMTYLQTVRKLYPLNENGNAKDQTMIMYMAYKWPTEDDYYERNALSAEYITANEGVIGLKLVPGIRIQEYIGNDYTDSNGVKLGAIAPMHANPAGYWANVAPGTRLFLTAKGQFTTATTNSVSRAQLIECKGNWITIEITAPTPGLGAL